MDQNALQSPEAAIVGVVVKGALYMLLTIWSFYNLNIP